MRRPAGDLEQLEALVAMKLQRLTTLALASVVSLGLLAGCVGGGSPASNPSGEPPSAPDLDSWPGNMQACLEEKGWDVEVSPDGGMNMTVPTGQEDAYDTDVKACEESFGYDVVPVYSDDQVREIYKKVVATAQCLAEQGHDPGTPPSEQTFVEQVQNGPGGWDPYSDLYPATMDDEEYYAALGECPRTWH